jgi:branched-subunit amino acid transport protein
MDNVWWILTAMALVTFLPRMLPFVLFKNWVVPEKLDRFLSLIPYTMLAALIFPGVLSASDNMLVSLGAMGACIVAATRKTNPTIVVLIGIGVVYLLQQIG